MNANRYRLIYSEVHGEFIPVPEVTLSHSCVIPGISGSRVFPLQGEILSRVLKGLIVGSVALSPGIAQTIVPDGRTQTTVAVSGAVSNVTTTTIRSTNAFNSFSKFNVDAGNTVNLHLPTGTQNLINIVRDQQTSIYGILNAIKDGKIGGNVWFANPHGFLVGSTGVVNVGSLTVSTPTQTFVNDFFNSSTGNPEDALVSQLLAGTAPRSGSGLVSIQGKVNAIDGIHLSAGTINVGGALYSGAQFVGTAPNFTDVVNSNGLASGTNIIATGGQIHIVADEAVSITSDAGDAGALGSHSAKITVSGAEIEGKNITLKADAAQGSKLLPIVVEVVEAGITIDSSKLTAKGGNLVVEATATANASTKSLSPIEVGVVVSDASVEVTGASELTSTGTGNTTVKAISTVESTVDSGLPDIAVAPADAGVAVNVVVSTASTHVGGTTKINAGGQLEVDATNTVKATTTADSAAKGAVAVGGTAAVTEVTTLTQAYIDGSAAVTSGSISVKATSQNDLTTTAKASAKGAAKQPVDKDGKPLSKTEQFLAKFKGQASTPEGGVDVAAAVAIANVNSTTQAYLASTGTLSSDGALVLSSQALNTSKVVADGSATMSSVGIGAAVGVNIGVLTNQAFVADDSSIQAKGVTVSAISPGTKTNTFTTTATSGAGASTVGIAGALATNVLVNTTEAYLEGGSAVDADGGDVLVEAKNASSSSVTSGAVEKPADAKAQTPATVGIGASVGLNVAVNTTRAEVEDGATLTDANKMALTADGKHSVVTSVKGGASGAKVSVTPVGAVTVAVNTTTARLGSGVDLSLAGPYTSLAKQTSTVTSTATGQTQGDNVAIGASLALNTVVDTVSASVERNVSATGIGNGIDVQASSASTSSATATASVAGGHKADAKDKPAIPPTTGDTSGTGDPAKSDQTVDKQIGDQGKAAKDAAAVDKLPAADKGTATDKTSAKGATAKNAAAGGANTKLTAAGTDKSAPPKAESTEGGGVSVAAAVGVNVAVATTTASIGRGQTIHADGALKVSSTAQTDAKSSANGTQVDNAKQSVGVGAAVALNAGIVTNRAVIGDESHVTANGVTVSAVMPDKQKNDFGANAQSGAGASNVGVAGSLAVNVVIDTTEAYLEGDTDSDTDHTSVDAGTGDMMVKADHDSASTVSSKAAVNGTDQSAKVGVGASIGVNVVAGKTLAEVGNGAAVSQAKSLTIDANAVHTIKTTVVGGTAGAKVSITPVAAVAVAVNTTTARLGTSGTDLALGTGTLSIQAVQKDTVTTDATGRASGDVAVGASLAASVVLDHASASVERNVASSGGIDLDATSTTSLTTSATAGAKGAKAPAKKADTTPGAASGATVEAPEKGTTVEEQKDNQLKAAAAKNTETAKVDTTEKTKNAAPKAPDVNKDEKVDKNNPGGNKEQGKKVSVAAAIGVGVAENQATATTGQNLTLKTSGDLDIQGTTHTNYATKATGEAVSDDIGIAAAVALTVTMNKTQATLGAGTDVPQAQKVNIGATSYQNMDPAFLLDLSSESISGASGGDVAVAGSLAVVANDNETRASIDEGATIGTSATPVGDTTVKADDTSRISAQALAGALSKGKDSKFAFGASFAVLLSNNHTTAAVGYGTTTLKPSTDIFANSLAVTATKHDVPFPTLAKLFGTVKTTKTVDDLIDLVNPASYLSQTNYYSNAMAGAVGKGSVSATGAFAVNVFGNVTEAYLSKTQVTTSGVKNGLGVLVSAHSDADALSMAGAVGAAKTGIGISNTDIINSDQVLASVDGESTVISNHAGSTPSEAADVKVSADNRQDLINLAVSGGIGTDKAGVTGVLGVVVSLNKAQALIGEGSTVKSQGDISLEAANDSLVVMTAGGIGGGKEAGVGGSIAFNLVKNETVAGIGKHAIVEAKQSVNVDADASETAVTVVVAGAGGGKAGVAGALSVNTILTDTQAYVGEDAQVSADQNVNVTSQDDTVVVGVSGGLAGAGKVGVGAALDTTVLLKKVSAFIADDTDADGKVAKVHGQKKVAVNAASSDVLVSTSAGFGGGGNTGVGGAVSVGVVKNDVLASIGKAAQVDSNGNVLINAEDDVLAILTAGSAAGGGTAGVGGSLAVATLIGSSKAQIGAGAQVDARGNEAADTVYSGETAASLLSSDEKVAKTADFATRKTESAKGLSVTAYNREKLITTAASGTGAGNTGVAATVSANVIASTTEASIGNGARINENNGSAGTEQQVRVKAMDETLLVNTAAGASGGGTAGIGAAANVGVVAKNTKAWIGHSTQVNATKAVEVDASSAQMTFSTTVGFGGGGSAGIGGSVSGVGVANHTEAFIEDAEDATKAAKIKVTAGDLEVKAEDLATSWLLTGSGAGGGAAGVGGSLAVGVNASTTKARIGNFAETDASGDTSVQADSTENVNTITVAGAGGGSAGVAGSISAKVVVSATEAGIGEHAKINQVVKGQNVNVQAHDRIITVGAAGAGAGGGAAGVGGTADVTVVLNTTSAYIGNDADVSATKDVTVNAFSEKYVNSATIAGAGGGAAGVAGAVSVISVGSLLDGEAKSGLQVKETDAEGKNTGKQMTTQQYADGQTTKSTVGGMLGDSDQSTETKGVLDDNAKNMGIQKHLDTSTADVPLKNTQAFIGYGAKVDAGEDVKVSARDTTLAIVVAGSGAGGGAAGVAGAGGIVLLHDSAEAFIADGAEVDAKQDLTVEAHTSDDVYNVAITGSGAGAADVSGTLAVNVVTSDTAAYVGAADINKSLSGTEGQTVSVNAGSATTLVTAAGSGGGAGAASVGGIATTNVLHKTTKAYLAAGADVRATDAVNATAASRENVISGAISIRGAGAAAVSGAVSANVVDNTTEAFIGVGAVVDSDGNAKLEASDDTLIVSASAVGNGAGAAGVGGNAVANVVSSKTKAYVSDNATVNARGNAGGMTILDGGVGASAGTLPSVPGGQSGSLDFNNDGKEDGNLSQGASFNLTAGDGSTKNTSDGVGGKNAGAAPGGLAEQTRTTGVKGLAITATANEKIVSTTLSVAGSGAASVTGSASASVVKSETSATIGDGVKVNDSAHSASDPSVRLTAADNTLLVQVGGTISGSGVAAVSGAANVGVITKKTSARIGDSDVKARNIEIQAISGEDVYTIGANVSIAGAAGVGGTVGVAVIKNETSSSIGAGADIDATGDLSVRAEEDAKMDLYTVSGTGGLVGVSGALAVGVIDNTTKAYVEGDSVPAEAAVLDVAGTTEIAASSSQDINTVTVSASGGGVGIAGGVAVKVLKSETTAYLGENTQLNAALGASTQNVKVSAKDATELTGVTGSAAIGAYAVGAVADINIVRNTTTAYMGDKAHVNAGGDVAFEAVSTKKVKADAIAASFGASGSIAGSVSLAIVGAELDSTSQQSIGSGETAKVSDGQENVSGQLGSSTHLQGMKGDLAATKGTTKVSEDLNQVSTDSLDKTQAYVGKSAHVTTGGAISVSATDRTDLDLLATSVAVGSVGLGGAVGVGLSNSTTEAFIDSSSVIDADGDVMIHAKANNLDTEGSKVESIAGAGGIVGATAVVAVMKDTSTTQASIGNGADIQSATTLTIQADTARASSAKTFGTTVAGLAVGASVARAEFSGRTAAHVDYGVKIGKTTGKDVDNVVVAATDASTASAEAKAGSAGILSGAGADASAIVNSGVSAYIEHHADMEAQDNVSVTATGKASTTAKSTGVSAGAAAVGISLASAQVGSDVMAYVGNDSKVKADNLTVKARKQLPASGASATADSSGSSGGLIGINGSLSSVTNAGMTTSYIGGNSTLTGSVAVEASTDTQQVAAASGDVGGIVAAGAVISNVTSNTQTQAYLGDNVTAAGSSLTVKATGTDDNFASAKAGSGGLIAGSAAVATTTNLSNTSAKTGSGDGTHQIAVDNFTIQAAHTAKFNGEVDSVNAAIAGASGALASHVVNGTVLAEVGNNGRVHAEHVAISATNKVDKDWLGGTGDTARWNIRSGSGGVIDAPAGKSETHITQDTTAGIGEDAEVYVEKPTSGEGGFTMDALNEVKGYDKAKLDSGGAIAVAKAASLVYVDQADAIVSFGKDATVFSYSGDIRAGARSDIKLDTRAAADTFGLAGAPSGSAYSIYQGNNQALVKGGALLWADDGRVTLAGGRSSSGTRTTIDAKSTVNLWNKTAIPINQTPDAKTTIVNNASVLVQSGGGVEAASDIYLTADRGSVSANATGIGKDIYREAAAAIVSGISKLFGGGDVSFDVKGGTTQISGEAQVVVDGTVATGINRNESFTLDVVDYDPSDGSWTLKTTQTRGVHFDPAKDIDFKVGIAASINNRIIKLQALALQFAGTAAEGAYNAEILFLQQKLVDLGLAKWTTVNGKQVFMIGTGGAGGVSPRQAATELRDWIQVQKNRVVNTDLPPVQADWTTKKNALDSATTALNTATDNYAVYADRYQAMQDWSNAIANDDATAAATAKSAVLGYELTLMNGNLSYTATAANATAPNLTSGVTDRNTYNTSVVAPATTAKQAALDAYTPVDSQKNTLEAQRDALIASINGLNDRLLIAEGNSGYLSNVAPSGPSADFVTVPDIHAQLGSIHVKGDSLTGSGKLQAPGDAKVEITNNTSNFLIVNDITIDSEAAKLTFNDVEVNSNADINRLNPTGRTASFSEVVTGQSSEPKVIIKSTYNPNAAGAMRLGPAPDIQLQGSISNPRGLVQVRSEAGSILAQGTIEAGTVDVRANNGDYVQSYVDTFSHVGGDPAKIREGTSQPLGIVANGSVFISARYLNINGLVQSGIDSWNLTLPANGATLIGSMEQLGISQAAFDLLGGNSGTLTNDWGGTVTYNATAKRFEVTEAFARADAQKAQGKLRNPSGLYELVKSDVTGTIGSSYDAINDRYVLDGTEVKGGYIQLYGQIMNTAQNGSTTGKLKVLDGYGQINITNPSGKDIVLANLHTGTGVAGVIDITDIQGLDSNQSPYSIHSRITRNNGQVTVDQTGGWVNGTFNAGLKQNTQTTGLGTRTATYNPQSGLAYLYPSVAGSSIVEDYSYSGAEFFGSTSLRTIPNLVSYRIAGPYTVTDPVAVPGATYLLTNHAMSDYWQPKYIEGQTIPTGDPLWIKTREWTTFEWWSIFSFGAVQEYHINFSKITPSKTFFASLMKADNPIGIEFIGSNTGAINVHSAQNVSLTGGINNKAGSTTVVAGNSGTGVTAAGKSIKQGNSEALITTKDLALTASGDINGATLGDPAVRISATGIVNATAASGNVALRQTLGNLNIGSITAAGTATAGLGRVMLDADGDIVAASSSSLLQGNRLDLISENGKIGSTATPLKVNVGFDESDRGYYGLTAQAQGDIGIAAQSWSGNSTGDLLVNTVVSKGGDVNLSTPGRIIDNNPIEQVDTRTWDELVSYWNSVGLRAGSDENLAMQIQAIKAFEYGKNQNYRLYWQIRQRQANPSTYDASFQYKATAAEGQALIAAGKNVATFETERTAQYHQLNSEVGSLSTTYVADYQYQATDADRAQILRKSSWTDKELAISISPGALKEITNTNPVIKSANVQGRNVTLTAGSAMGETQNAVTIPTSIHPKDLTDAQKVALAAAERSDIVITDSQIVVKRRKPINFDALTSLSATVAANPVVNTDAGNMFLASLGDGRLNTIHALGDTRIKVWGSLINQSTTTPALQTGNLVLEAANGGIGYLPDTGSGETFQPMRIQLANGAALTARAAKNLDIIETAGDMGVDTVYSRQALKLTAEGSITDGYDDTELKVLGDTVELIATTGSIGAQNNLLDVSSGLTGGITASADQGVYLHGPMGHSFNIASVHAGDAVKLVADVDMKIDGDVESPGTIGLVSGGTTTMTTKANVHATALDLSIDAGALTMEDDGTSNAKMQVDAGTINITTEGDAIITGITSGNGSEDAVNITSRNGHIWAGHALGTDHMDIIADTAPAAKLTMWAKLGIGEEPLHLRLLNLEATSGGVMDIDVQGSVNIVGSGLTAADRVLFTAGGSITGNSITGQTVSLSAPVQVNIGTVNVGSNLQIASNLINANVFGGNQVTGGFITGFNGGLASNVNLRFSSPSGFAFGNFWAVNANVNIPSGWLSAGNTLIGNRGVFNNPVTLMLVDQFQRGVQPCDVQLYSGQAPFSFRLQGNRVDTNAFVIYRDPMHEVISPSGDNRSVVEQSGDALAQSQAGQSKKKGDDEEPDGIQESLITYAGFPVSLEGE